MPKKITKKPIATRKQKIQASRAVHSTSSVLNSNASVTIEYLDNPVKSQADENEYRVVKLPNGLTAMLVLRPGIIGEDFQNGNKTDDSNGLCKDEKEEFQWYRRMMVQGKTIFPETSCKLCINVGSFDDPLRVPGTSCILSRTIVMGSKKYPQLNDFPAFIIDNGGFRISYDRCETTTFYFQIPDKSLRPAIDRFAQFFVNPLMKRNSIIDGRNEIVKDFRETLQFPDYPDRKEHLMGRLGTPGSPVRTFGEHYLAPLCRVSDDEVYGEVLKFREKHYTADRMTLVIESRLPLDTLEDYVKEYFSKIPKNISPAASPSPFNFADCFRTRDFRKVYEMKPLLGDIDERVLEMSWSTPPRRRFYRCNPHKYLSWLFERDGDGSLLNYLRVKRWCKKLYSGVEDRADNSIYSLFTISLVLTEDGYDNRKSVLESVYSYVNFLRREGPQKRIHDEIRMIEEANFRFGNNSKWSSTFHDLGENMHVYPSSEYLTGSILCFEYDRKTIEICTNFLTADRANVIIFDKNFNEIERSFDDHFLDEDDEKVYFERIYYASYEVPEQWIEYWKFVEPFLEFKFPPANVYVADDFTLISSNENFSRYPEKIYNDNFMEIWYMGNEKFRLPECHMIFHYVNPLAMTSSENAAMLDLFATTIKNFLLEELHDAKLAGLKYDVRTSERGLEILVNGFNQKAPLLMETIIKRMTEFPDLIAECSFAEMKEKQLKAYLDVFSNAAKLAEDVRLSILRRIYWTSIDKHAAIIELKHEKFQNFTSRFTDRGYVQCYGQGNIEKSAIIDCFRGCVKILSFKQIFAINFASTGIREIPRSPRCCRLKGFGDDDWIKNYYQFDTSSWKISVMIDLLIIIMNNPLCEDLETLEELHHWDFHPVKEIHGYSLAVKPYRSRKNGQIVWGDTSIEKFRKLLNKTVKDLSNNEWHCVKKVLTNIKSVTDENPRDVFASNWHEISTGECIFDRRETELKIISDLEIKDLREFMSFLTAGGPNLQKLSVQVVGRNIAKPEQNKEVDEYRLEYLTALPSLKEKITDYYISDIEVYKRDLRVFPFEEKLTEKMKVC